MPSITAHMLVQNEDRFVWYAIQSVLPYVEQFLITDNGSTDHTLDIIKSISSPKIKLTQLETTDRQGLVTRRKQQMAKTQTDWFLLVDGDEIWPQDNLRFLINTANQVEPRIMAFFNRTRNCVGDLYHYQPESAGRYHIAGISGHLNIRLIRNHPDISLQGEYPHEAYTYQNQPLQNQPDHIQFVDTWYLHTTHLPRSTRNSSKVIDRLQKYKFEIGLPLSPQQLPEVFHQTPPQSVLNPLEIKYTIIETIAAHLITPIKNIRRNIRSNT